MSLLNHHAQRKITGYGALWRSSLNSSLQHACRENPTVYLQHVLPGTQHSQARAAGRLRGPQATRLAELAELAQSLLLPPAHWPQGNQTSCHLQASTAPATARDPARRAHENAHRYSMKAFRNFYLHPSELSSAPVADPKLRRGDRTRSGLIIGLTLQPCPKLYADFRSRLSLESRSTQVFWRRISKKSNAVLNFLVSMRSEIGDINPHCLARLILGIENDGAFPQTLECFNKTMVERRISKYLLHRRSRSGCSAHPAVCPPEVRLRRPLQSFVGVGP